MTSVIGDTNPDTPTSDTQGVAMNNKMVVNYKSEEKELTAASILLPSQIKQEDPLDIDDTHLDDIKRMPIISLTPTVKLLATPNPTDPKRKFVCPYTNCGKSYGKSSHLRSHLTWHTGIKPFVCQEINCGKGFTRSDELNRHVRTHTGEKPFECMQCMKKFSRSDHLTKHLATHVKQQTKTRKRGVNANDGDKTNDSPIPTPIPKPSTRQQPKRMLLEMNNLSGHAMGIVPTNDKKQQEQSTEIYSAKELFKDHFQGNVINVDEEKHETGNSFVHEPIKIKLERPENSSEYQIVPTSLLRNTSIQDINEVNSGVVKEEVIVGGDDEIMPEANVPSSLPLDVIIKDEPVDPETERPFSCETCFRTFRRETDLNRHKHVHSDSRNLSSAAGQLQSTDVNGSHDASLLQCFKGAYIDPERPFSCKQCEKAFRRQDDLHRHMRTHTGEKPYACNECDRRFVRSDHLKKHLQTHIRLR